MQNHRRVEPASLRGAQLDRMYHLLLGRDRRQLRRGQLHPLYGFAHFLNLHKRGFLLGDTTLPGASSCSVLPFGLPVTCD